MPRLVARLAHLARRLSALAALLAATAAAAQAPLYDPSPPADGALPWLFAVVVTGAVVAVFLFVLWVMPRPGPPGTPQR